MIQNQGLTQPRGCNRMAFPYTGANHNPTSARNFVQIKRLETFENSQVNGVFSGRG
ncbi:hypothetical protein FBZ88_10992 [Nitrospirillum bahiense]|uniref:Uncharacterized protein n=1 Tax=Nitrospirillum amazonense TaxID=28077 RepID=A0A560FVM5_9PROT|nr:hypothetical protein FBZ88_10992 [Nitrospirillum amazonense]